MVSIDVLIKVKEALFKELVLPGDTGFWGVGIGNNEVILYYDKAKAKRQVVVASTYSIGDEAVSVRVVESPMPSILPNFRKAAKPLEGLPSCFTAVDRPLQAGASVCDCSLDGACSSTGPFIDLDTGEVVWVTCAHCTLFSQNCDGEQSVIGRPMSQPSPGDGGQCPMTLIGTVYKATPNFWANQPATTDTVAIRLLPGISVSTKICGTDSLPNGPVYLSGRYRVPNVNDTICKAGRTTGVQCGTVQSIHASAMVDYGCFVRQVDDVIITTKILEAGDSGSIGFDPNTGDFLGQGFAGSDQVSLFISPEQIYKVLHLVPYGGQQQAPTQPGTLSQMLCDVACSVVSALGCSCAQAAYARYARVSLWARVKRFFRKVLRL